MDELNRNRSFADSRSHSLYGTMPNVAYGEETGNIGLEQEGIPVERPPLGALAVSNEVRPSQQKTAVISLYQTSQPIGSRQGANEDEHGTRWHALQLACVRTKHGNLFQMSFPMRFGQGRMGPHCDVGHFFDLVDQILRHSAGKRISANQDHNAVGVSREVHCSLARRIRASYNVNSLALAGKRFCGPSAIVNTCTLQAIDSRSFKPPPLDSACDHQRVTGNLAFIRQLNDAIRPFRPNTDSFLWRKNLHSETLRLDYCASGEIASAESGRKSQIVLNPRTHSRLAAGRFAFNHHRMQAFRCAVDGCREARWAAAHNCQIVKVGL